MVVFGFADFFFTNSGFLAFADFIIPLLLIYTKSIIISSKLEYRYLGSSHGTFY